MRLHQMVYFSQRGQGVEIAPIVETARRNNADLGITGALLVLDGHFLQVLEGPRTALSRLYADISEDTRHDNCTLALFHDIDDRIYGDWDMYELNANDDSIRHILDASMGPEDDFAALSGLELCGIVQDCYQVGLARVA